MNSRVSFFKFNSSLGPNPCPHHSVDRTLKRDTPILGPPSFF